MNSSLSNVPEISFIDNITLSELTDQMIKDYQDKLKEITGKDVPLGQADPYRMIMYACSLQQYQGFQYADRAGKQNLAKYSYGDFIEFLASTRGITRLEAQPASTMLRFSIASALASTVSIPEGTRVTNGNEVYFATDEYTEIVAGSTYVDVPATCTAVGISGNGFRAGEINILVETLPYITSVQNTVETSGGNDRETDDALAERIYIAPSSYSVAGPEDAYIYWTKTVSTEIKDVKVNSPSPCVVDVRFILTGGELPGEILIQKVTEVLRDKNIRPMTDYVQVSAPEVVNYNIDLKYYIGSSNKATAVTIQKKVEEAVAAYKTWQSEAIGRTINPQELISRVRAAGANRAIVTSPTDTVITKTQIAKAGTVSVVYGGIEDD